MTAPEPTEAHRRVMEALSGHRYRDVLGDYETPPHYRHFGCSCGAEWNIAGMSGWRSWVATYEAHLADVILAALGAETREDITLDDLGRGDSVIARRTVTSFPPIVGKWRPA